MLRSLNTPGNRRWPSYLAYKRPIGRGNLPVPNRSSIDWPQAQFAPRFLPPGSPSFSPYRYPDGPIVDYPLRYDEPKALVGELENLGAEALALEEGKSWVARNPGLALAGFIAALTIGYYYVLPAVTGSKPVPGIDYGF